MSHAKITVNPKWWHKLHWSEYGAELLGTAILVFVGLSAVVFNFAQGLPMEQLIPNRSLRLLITGLMFSGTGSLVAISPLGKLSGAHVNPAVSLAFWLQGKMHLQDIGGYIIAQFLGAISGAVLLVFLWGKYAVSVNNGVTSPGLGYSLWYVFTAEVTMTAILVLAIFIFVSNRRLMRWTPLMTWLLVAIMVWLGAPISGTSLNPARSIGPAFVTWFWTDQWLYCIAPPLGAILAVWVFRLISFGQLEVLTGKLFHVPNYRCIFKNVKVPHR
ncbi:MAG: aquaporin [Scytonema sp. PMC 1069.18]|nr:aquaporin [Scytonema sp. PMC 1069.18]MEC4881574.1 aquaporin [Scytonema sp. PMC 1070.18]